ncbi:hypothetical protein [Corynebacterium sp. HMSC04H06]|uniref:hypothetical protein n=1 Tax=Corynebacterium sp. HMSC04H06 TaxID=1581050 RepID=UPI0008A438BD|nr:hypothetical protein [Corynebacterium sp. HMSC04H06]OFS20247.1 hypothetical protein HMPREF3067_08370 [Corynebacterium sp. HMSC04H06]
MRYALLWDTALGFCGFFAALALIQAVVNLFRPEPVLWPGLLAGVLCLALYGIYRAKRAHLARIGPSGQPRTPAHNTAPQNTTPRNAAPRNTLPQKKDRV